MKRHPILLALLLVVALAAVACGGDDDGGDGAASDGGSRTTATQREDPRSALIADKALLTSQDFPAWWGEIDVNPQIAEVLLESQASCEGILATEIAQGTSRNARSGPVSFKEVDGFRRVDVSIFTYPDVAAAEAFMDELQGIDLAACFTNLFDAVAPGALAAPATESAPAFGEEAISIQLQLNAHNEIPEAHTYSFTWIRVDRAVALVNVLGTPGERPDQYINKVVTRLSEELSTT